MEKNLTVNNKIEVLVIGGSAGAFDVLSQIIPKIKPSINFAIIIILHRKISNANSISRFFSSKTLLTVTECEEKESILPAHIYFAPADYHLLVENNRTFSLDYSEKVNYSRPSIDITFKNLADIYQQNLAALLLSGANADGVDGLKYVQENNGTTIVQHPNSAEVKYMPQQAIKQLNVNYVLNIEQIVTLINNFNI